MRRTGGAGPDPDDVRRLLRTQFGIRNAQLRDLRVPVNDVLEVTAPAGHFALKIYHSGRSVSDVRWEADLVRHLHSAGAPVAQLVPGRDGHVTALTVDGLTRVATLVAWVPGGKPRPGPSIYQLLGRSAALIHAGADTFPIRQGRAGYDAAVLIDEQLARMKAHLVRAERWPQARDLGDRLHAHLADETLDVGICHMDLTLDNVHLADDQVAVFDFDSAGTCWRAVEPHGVLRYSLAAFASWLEGYRTVRDFPARDERTVHAFTVIGDLRVVAWQLGVAASSRGTPLLTAEQLPAIVDRWLALEAAIPSM